MQNNVSEAVEAVASHLHPTPSWEVDFFDMPAGRSEFWRFTPVNTFAPLMEQGAASTELEWESTLPEGLTVTEISAEHAQELAVEAPVDRVAAMAFHNAKRHMLIDVPADLALNEPAVITLTGTGQSCFGHILIRVGRHARVTLVIRQQGSARYAIKTDVEVADGAQLNLVTIEDWDDDALHGGQTSYRIGRDATVRTIHASLGGQAIRLVERAQYAGPGGSLEQYGVYFADAGQHIEHRLFVDHNQPKTKSVVDYRGALQGKGAHSVWVGDVLIRKVAEGIETYEANKNLVLTDGCKADSVPNLEIETGEIAGAGHSSTTGRFDDEQMFYLMSRGIPEAEAKRLVVHGFFVDIVRRIGVPEIEQRLIASIDAELEQAIGSLS